MNTGSGLRSGWRTCVACLLVSAAWFATPDRAEAQLLFFSISPSTVSFTSGDPDTTPTLHSNTITMQYTVFLSGGANWRITVQADDDFVNGSARIPASVVTWTASPAPPFQNGTLSRTQATTVAAGAGDVLLSRSGTMVFSMPNAWSYEVGTYNTSLLYTLSCP